jgi:hypothetical protein
LFPVSLIHRVETAWNDEGHVLVWEDVDEARAWLRALCHMLVMARSGQESHT